MIGTLLTGAIGLFAKGRAAKAIASSVGGGLLGILGGPEVVDAFQSGIGVQLIEPAHEAGRLVGMVLGGGVNWLLAYYAPKNAD